MNTFVAFDLPEGKFFEEDALIDKKFIVCPAGVPISSQLKKGLIDWEFDKVFSEGEIVEKSSLFVGKSESDEGAPEKEGDELEPLIEEEAAPEKEGKADAAQPKPPAASDLDNGRGKTRRADIVQDEELESVKVVYEFFLAYAVSFYEKYAATQSINAAEVNERIKEFCVFMRKNRRHVLRLQAERYKIGAKSFLGEHAVRSTVFAEAIAIQLSFPMHRMIELGVSCFLHEIGMTLLPPKILDSKEPLSEQERKAVTVHPVLSYNILREAEFPLNICIGVLEHHERENGNGYPRHLKKDQISIYAKIIAVACSYEAATSKRPFKEEKDAFSGIIDILRNDDRQYEPSIVQALLHSLSLYPIGSYVLLSDGRRGQVVDINPEDPKYPVVQVLGEYKPDGAAKTIETSEYGVYISRSFTKEEVAALRG